MNEPNWQDFAQRALDEDRAFNDITTGLLGSAASIPASGRFIAEEAFVVAGIPLARAVYGTFDAPVDFVSHSSEGDWVRSGDVFATVRGPTNVLLSAERVALNFLQRLSGIATQTRKAVDSVAGSGASILDTRKTTPGLRAIERYAVRVAGGVNHRSSLEDAVLWKDNHWAVARKAGQTLADALESTPKGVQVEVEIEREDQLAEVIEAGVKYVLIDNQTPETITRWVRRLGDDVIVEASGGITLERAHEFAQAGVQRISMGALTHSVRAASISFALDGD